MAQLDATRREEKRADEMAKMEQWRRDHALQVEEKQKAANDTCFVEGKGELVLRNGVWGFGTRRRLHTGPRVQTTIAQLHRQVWLKRIRAARDAKAEHVIEMPQKIACTGAPMDVPHESLPAVPTPNPSGAPGARLPVVPSPPSAARSARGRLYLPDERRLVLQSAREMHTSNCLDNGGVIPHSGVSPRSARVTLTQMCKIDSEWDVAEASDAVHQQAFRFPAFRSPVLRVLVPFSGSAN